MPQRELCKGKGLCVHHAAVAAQPPRDPLQGCWLRDVSEKLSPALCSYGWLEWLLACSQTCCGKGTCAASLWFPVEVV